MTLIEVLIALVIVSAAIIPLMGVLGMGVGGAARADEMSYVTDLAREWMEDVKTAGAQDLEAGTVTWVVSRAGEGGRGHTQYEVVRAVTAVDTAGENSLWLVTVSVHRYPRPEPAEYGKLLVSLSTYLYAGGL